MVPGKLKQADENDYQVVIFSNQGGISMSKESKSVKGDSKRLNDFKARLNAITSQLDVPISVYAATEKDQYRKPRKGMWKEMTDYYDLDREQGPDLEGSFYVGDAAGRLVDEGNKGSDKDFASSDRDFAANVGIPFRTPEEHFLSQPVRAFKRAFDPNTYVPSAKPTSHRPNALSTAPNTEVLFQKGSGQEIVLFVGSPGAGKSTFFRTFLAPHSYVRVNQDTLKSRDKCIKAASTALLEGKSVAVDNTNANRDVRKYWVDLATKVKVPIRVIWFTADAKLCEHNDAVRAWAENKAVTNPEDRTPLPKIAFIDFAKRFQEPSLDEGLTSIDKVDFVFRGSEEDRKIWAQYWT